MFVIGKGNFLFRLVSWGFECSYIEGFVYLCLEELTSSCLEELSSCREDILSSCLDELMSSYLEIVRSCLHDFVPSYLDKLVRMPRIAEPKAASLKSSAGKPRTKMERAHGHRP